MLDDEDIRSANTSPWCMKAGYTKDILREASTRIPIRIGSVRFRAETIAMFDEELLIGFREPESPGGPLRFNAVFTDPAGNPMLRIVDNECRAGVENFDVQTTNDILSIQDKQQDVIFRMSLMNKVELHIERLHMQYRGFDIHASDDGFMMSAGGGTAKIIGDVHANVGIWMKSSGQALIGVNGLGGAAICLNRP